MRKILAGLFAFAFSIAPAAAQTGQLGAGQVWANPTGAQAPAIPSSVSALLDQALGSTRGAIIERGASGWVQIGPGSTAGIAFISNGAGADPSYQLLNLLNGATSGTATPRLPLLSQASAAPIWGAFTLPASVTSGGVAAFSSTSVMGSTAGGNTTQVLHGNGTSLPTFGSVVSGDLSITTTTCTNQVVTAISASAAGTCSSITYAMIAAGSLATSANLEAGAASTLLSASIIYDAEQTITFAASQTFDFNTFLNGRLTLTANITSLTCSNMKASQSGVISLVQDGTGTRTMVAAWCSQFRWAIGARGVLSTSPNAIDALFYQCVSTSICYVSISKAQAN